MYDRNAKNAIRALFKQKDAGPDTFLDSCYTLRMQEQWNIKMAQSEWGACYPYPIRILDKYLWLKGSKTAKCVLKRFQAACRDLARHHSEP